MSAPATKTLSNLLVIVLGLNGYSLSASETEVVTTMLAVADNQWPETDLAECCAVTWCGGET